MLDQDTIAMLQEVLADSFADVVHTYIGDAPSRLQAMRDAASTHDLQMLEAAAHALKGSSSNIGARRVCDLASVLVDQCRAGAVEDAPTQIDAIENSFQSTKSALLALI